MAHPLEIPATPRQATYSPPRTVLSHGITWTRYDAPGNPYGGKFVSYETTKGPVDFSILLVGRSQGYWCAFASQAGAVGSLDSRTKYQDGKATAGPLWGKSDPPDHDPPMRLLRAASRLIAKLPENPTLDDELLQDTGVIYL